MPSRLSAALAMLLAVSAPVRAADPETARRPNIVLIMADDMGYSDLGCYGGEIRTHNLDRLAGSGQRFSQFYNNAKCNTTRASVLTGLYPRRDGSLLKPEMVTVGEALRLAGYQTVLSGKWHLGATAPHRPIDRGFDEYYGLMDGCCNYFNPAQPDPPYKANKVRVFGHNDRLITEFPEGFYTTDAFTDHAIQTVRRFEGTGKPFFLHLCYTAPHYPLHAPADEIAKYRGKYKMGWEEMRRQRHARQLAMGLLDSKWPLSATDSQAYDWESANQDWEDHRMATYAAMVDRLDQNVGRLLKTLDDLGIADETVVMFLADNGGCTEEPGGRDDTQEPGRVETYTAVGPGWGWAQNTPFRRYKSWVNEGGISTPLIVRWPGVTAPGTITHQPGHIIDLLPTCLELAGASYPETHKGQAILPVEGKSLAPVFRGQVRDPHDLLFWEWSGNKAVRQGSWKLVYDKLVNQWALFDVEVDRTELNDRSADYPDRVRELIVFYDGWAKRTGLDKKKSKDKNPD